MHFLGIGPMELVVILLVALIIFGPERLPEIGRALGRSVRQFREFSQEITSDLVAVKEELESASESVVSTVEEVKGELEEASQSLRQATDIQGILESPAQKPSPPEEDYLEGTVIYNEDVLPAGPEPSEAAGEEYLEGMVIYDEDLQPSEAVGEEEESSDIADFLPTGEPPAASSQPTQEAEAEG